MKYLLSILFLSIIYLCGLLFIILPHDKVSVNEKRSLSPFPILTSNNYLTSLDLIDPVQGKISGIAEQDLAFKTYYDPASYNIGDTSVVVDTYGGWTNDTVGKLWWDLSAVKYYNYYQNDITYQTNFWSEVFPGTDIAIWEWVESNILPSEWDSLADTEEGIAQGISGLSKYGDNAYSQQLVWDTISNSTSTKYYFWVLNKKTIPEVDFRNLSASAVQQLIKDPAGAGYKFAALMSKDRFSLFNVAQLMEDKDIALNIRYYTTSNKNQNIHNEYQMIAQGVATSKPNKDIERKWFDSLIGYDAQFRLVPDPKLSAKAKYGVSNNPRQSMFINKAEAYKEVIERVNDILIKNIIVDEFNINDLTKSDPQPLASSRRYDLKIDTYEDLAFVGHVSLWQ